MSEELAEHSARRVLLFDRPWNRRPTFPPALAPRIRRVSDWEEIAGSVATP